MKEQIHSIRIARARLAAEISVARKMLPDDVESELHFNGAFRTIEKYPEWRPLIDAIEGNS